MIILLRYDNTCRYIFFSRFEFSYLSALFHRKNRKLERKTSFCNIIQLDSHIHTLTHMYFYIISQLIIVIIFSMQNFFTCLAKKKICQRALQLFFTVSVTHFSDILFNFRMCISNRFKSNLSIFFA